ncbi:MAG: transglutaminase domain-containing protein, partial [Verrucomicrobia bacterium]|nr:transglutaminase domain-containing protein [Verrucomicrobiota bacterium]
MMLINLLKQQAEFRSHVAHLFAVIVLLVPNESALSIEPIVREHGEEAVDQVEELLLANDIRPVSGFSYIAGLTKNRVGDQNGGSSYCVLLEDGKPLSTPHAKHSDIGTKGAGRYSHWTKMVLYFSASDNTDPRTNGREYVLLSKQKAQRYGVTVHADQSENSYQILRQKERKVSNRRLIIRNLDSETTVIPRLTLEGWPDLSSREGIIKSILRPGMSDEEKTLAIWKFLSDWRYHYPPAEPGNEIHDPVKFINVYGYGFCDDSARNAVALATLAGIRSRIWGLDGHVVAETFYNDRWHMIDPDHKAYYRTDAGHVASVEELAAHPEIIRASKRDPIGADSSVIAELYSTTHNNRVVNIKEKTEADHRLEPRLEPGDELIFDFRNQASFHSLGNGEKKKPPIFANGKLLRQVAVKNGVSPIFVEWPYVILGGDLQWKNLPPAGGMFVSISSDGKKYEELVIKSKAGMSVVSLDAWITSRKKAIYKYWLKFGHSSKESESTQVELITRFQFAPRALAQVQDGGSKFQLFLRTPDDSALPQGWKGLEITH